MANQILAHMLNAMAIKFGSVLTIGEADVKNIFLKLESAGLRTFLGQSSQEIYPKKLQDFYSTRKINSHGSIVSTVNGQLLTISEDSFGELFLLHSDGLTHLAEVKASDVEEMQTLLSADGRKIKVSDPKKELKHEVQLLADIVAKGLLAKAGSFASLTLEKFQAITIIMAERRLNWKRLIFTILKNMFQSPKQSKGFPVQLSY